jgi:hypothetical protein
MLRSGASWLVACAWVTAFGPVVASRARAETAPPYLLSYEATEGCPPEAAFREDTLAHVHDTSGSAGAKVAVRIEATEGGFRGELVATDYEGNEGRRSIDGATCANVAHALAFLAGLAIELGGHLEKAEPAPPPTPPPQAAPAPPPVVAPRVQPPPAAPQSHALDASAAILADLRTGLAPEVRPALEVAADLEDRRAGPVRHAYRLAVVGALSELAGSGGTASLTYLAGRLEGCPLRFGGARLGLGTCLAFEIGYVWAESHATTNPRNNGQVWPTGEASLRLKYVVSGGLFLEADVGVGVPMIRPQYFFQPDRVLYQVPAVTLRAALGVGYRF